MTSRARIEQEEFDAMVASMIAAGDLDPADVRDRPMSDRLRRRMQSEVCCDREVVAAIRRHHGVTACDSVPHGPDSDPPQD